MFQKLGDAKVEDIIVVFAEVCKVPIMPMFNDTTLGGLILKKLMWLSRNDYREFSAHCLAWELASSLTVRVVDYTLLQGTRPFIWKTFEEVCKRFDLELKEENELYPIFAAEAAVLEELNDKGEDFLVKPNSAAMLGVLKELLQNDAKESGVLLQS